MPKNPLLEVFGYPVGNMSQEAINHREGRLCPYHNSSGLNCTKNSATDPLGVCTIVDGDDLAITCPVRLRQDMLIVADAARFFFTAGTRYVALTEVRLNDKHRKSAGNINIVIVASDEKNQISDFGALEVQAVYISGNVSKAFMEYMKNPAVNHDMEWPSKNYPKPDYLSSSRKRLTPQLIYKGGILNGWGKKIAVAVHRTFFNQLPALPEVALREADIAWLISDMKYDETQNRYMLFKYKTVYSKFEAILNQTPNYITLPDIEEKQDFIKNLYARTNENLEDDPEN